MIEELFGFFHIFFHKYLLHNTFPLGIQDEITIYKVCLLKMF